MKIIDRNFSSGNNFPIFSKNTYLNYCSRKHGWLHGYKNNKLHYVMPYTYHKKYFYRYIIFHTPPNSFSDINDITCEKEYLNSSIKYIQKYFAVDAILPSPTYSLFRVCPDDCISSPYGTYTIDLNLTESHLWKNINKRQRTYINKAIKNQVLVTHSIELKRDIWKMISSTMERNNSSFISFEKFNDLIEAFNSNIKLFVSVRNDEIQGCAVIPFNKSGAYYLYGGSLCEPFTGSVKLLHWEIIRHLKTLGVNKYDFTGIRLNPPVGSKQHGIKKFKSQFGGTLIEGYLWKKIFNKWNYCLYKVAMKLNYAIKFKKRYEGDIVDQEKEMKLPGTSRRGI